ncbi:hypothetical protein TRFO_41602 [Tritrichomonas foetus]|uniref:Uncharacterized protein n=1 Tax=Tritrichomonas foetus TaxID=1144522 RepID=A0A1J4KZS0_9EUKA|nr:hypothetical protein TRFO_41602 [Tritrichomonas foetus]|eukprot:OHT16751.1 hypothetical protein TRFO_41602 [Tritrichomonas foetus]
MFHFGNHDFFTSQDFDSIIDRLFYFMNHEAVLHLSQQCNIIVQTRSCDKEFQKDLIKFADYLLSSSSSDPNQIQIDANFQALILLLSKLVITCFDVIPNHIFLPLFRAIVAFNLHYFSVSRQEFTNFLNNEWSLPFSRNYIHSIFTNFYSNILKTSKIAEFSIMTLFLNIYFSDEPSSNPFVKNIENLPSNFYSLIFDPIQATLNSDISVILLYTLLVLCPSFKSYCISCVDVSWAETLSSPILKPKTIESAEIRLDILLIFTEDTEFTSSLSKQKGISLKLIRELITFIKHNLKANSAITTALTVIMNIGQRLSGFDVQTADSLFSLIRILLKSIQSDKNEMNASNGNEMNGSNENDRKNKYCEYVRLLILFIESLAVHRTRANVELIYTAMRHADVLEKVKSIVNQSENPEDFTRSIKNIENMNDYLVKNVIDKNPNVSDYQKMLSFLISGIESWNPEEIFSIIAYPAYTFMSNDFRQSLKFFRVMILKEVQPML